MLNYPILDVQMCARNMWHYCDSDGSKRITMEEWSSCLGMTETSKAFITII